MTELRIRTGCLAIPFRENADIAVENFLAGRPLDDGQKPARYVPDDRLPEYITLRLPE